MALKRSWMRLDRTGSFSFVEILLETLLVLILVTELSVECGKRSFPGWQQSRVEPTFRLDYAKLVAGISRDRVLTPLIPIDASTQSNLAGNRKGSMLLFSATAALYTTFTAFLFFNRNWKPPVIPSADKSITQQCRFLSVITWKIFGVYGAFAIIFVNTMGWWDGRLMIVNDLVIYLLCMWIALVSVCGLLSGVTREYTDKEKVHKSMPCTAVAQKEARVTTWIFTLLRVYFFAPLLLAGGLLWLCLVWVSCFAAALLLGVSPLISTVMAIGLLRGVVAVFGEAAALLGLVGVSCLLIMHCSGRLMGIWMADGSVTWIVKKVQKFRSLNKNMDATESQSKIVSIDLDTSSTPTQEKVNISSANSTYVLKFLLDGMVVCVLSSALWHLYVSGTTHDPDDADPWTVLTSGKLPQCLLTTMAALFDEPMESNHTCNFLHHPFSPVESKAMDASFVISGLLIVPSVLTLTVGILLICLKLVASCCGFEKPSPADSVQAVPSFYELHSGLAAFPLYFVKVLLPLYALDLLPGNWYIPGIAVYLVGCAVCFYWKLVKGLAVEMKTATRRFKKDPMEERSKEKTKLIWKGTRSTSPGGCSGLTHE